MQVESYTISRTADGRYFLDAICPRRFLGIRWAAHAPLGVFMSEAEAVTAMRDDAASRDSAQPKRENPACVVSWVRFDSEGTLAH